MAASYFMIIYLFKMYGQSTSIVLRYLHLQLVGTKQILPLYGIFQITVIFGNPKKLKIIMTNVCTKQLFLCKYLS